MIIIGRPINGVTLNGLEYCLDDDGELLRFSSETEGREFLHENGMDDKEIKETGVQFIEEE